MPVAVGTSLLVIAVNSATALAARATAGGSAVDWAVVGVFTAAAVAGSLFGGRLATRVHPQHLSPRVRRAARRRRPVHGRPQRTRPVLTPRNPDPNPP